MIYIFFKITLNNRFSVFKIEGLHCHELILCKWVSLQNPRYWDESQDEKCPQGRTGFSGRDTSINSSCTAYKS